MITSPWEFCPKCYSSLFKGIQPRYFLNIVFAELFAKVLPMDDLTESSQQPFTVDIVIIIAAIS